MAEAPTAPDGSAARLWSTPTELANGLIERAKAGKDVWLTADTAYLVGLWLQHIEKLPSRDDVVRMICRTRTCEERCYACIGRANEIVDAYGERPPPYVPRRKGAEIVPFPKEKQEQPAPAASVPAEIILVPEVGRHGTTTLGDLRQWHMVLFRCGRCSDHGYIELHELVRRFGKAALLNQIERAARCPKCKERNMTVEIRKMPR